MKVFILSAGLGTRLKPLTNDRPKVMVEIGGRPVLEHLVNLCSFHGFKDIIINLHHLPEVITNYFQDGNKFGVHINYSREIDKILGGAGAIKHASALLGNEPFFLLSGDVMTNVNLKAMLKFHQDKDGLASFLVHQTDHPLDSDLVEFDDQQLIKRFFRPQMGDEFKPIAKTGTHIFNPEILNFIPEGLEYSLEKQLIPDLLAKGKKLYAYYSNCYSKDMGTLARLEQVEKDYQHGQITF